jgi:hypothetical protein
MNRQDYKLFSLLIVLAVLVPAVLGLSLDWAPWTWIVATVVLAGLITAVDRQVRHRREQEYLHRHAANQPQPRIELPASRYPLAVTPLASAKPDYDFTFSCTMVWRPTGQLADGDHGDPRAIAADQLVGRAAVAVAHESPGGRALAQHRLAATLGYPEEDRSGRFVVWAEDIVLGVPDEDANRLRQLADLRKQEELWEQKRGYERNIRAYLGDEVLRDTGSAVVWWLANHADHVRETAGLIGTLAELSAAANNTEVDALFRHLVSSGAPPVVVNGAVEHSRNGSSPDSVDQYLPEFGDGKAMFGHQLADLLESHDEGDRAARVRDSYNAGEPPTLSGELRDPDED